MPLLFSQSPNFIQWQLAVNSPPTTDKRTLWVGALVAAALLGVVAYGIVGQRQVPSNREAASAASVASVATQRTAVCARSEDCDCWKQAMEKALNDALPANAVTSAAGADAKCANDLAALHAEALAAVGRTDEARRAVQAVLARSPQNADARRGLAILAIASHKWDEATVLLDALLRKNPTDFRSRFYSAFVAHQQGRYDDARQGYLKVLAAHPGHIDARYELVVLTFDAGVVAEARHHLKKLEEIAPPGDPRLVLATTRLQSPNQKSAQPPVTLHVGSGAPAARPAAAQAKP